MKNADDERAMMLAAALCGVKVDRVLVGTFDGPYWGKAGWTGHIGITHEQHQHMLDESYLEGPVGVIPFGGPLYICLCCTFVQRGR